MLGRLPLLFLLVLARPSAAQKPVPGATAPAGAAVNDQSIRPPFSLEWAEDSKRVELKIAAAKLTIKERRRIDTRWALVVTGFQKPDANNKNAPKPPALHQVVFYFGGGRLAKDKMPDGKAADLIIGGVLVEVELQYQQEGWLDADYNKCLGEKRQLLERTYGVGQQIVRETTELPEGKGSTTIVGYKWNRNNTAVELVYFTAEAKQEKHAFHTLSLHYKSDR
jgi:hypothetical protein